ncbi:META domain-containing protein [Nonlabens ponticola]|nr:META domain-containing protein [Nonlabens ponticola]
MKILKVIVPILFLALISYSCEETRRALDTGSRIELNGAYDVTLVDGENMRGNNQTINFNGLSRSVNGFAGCNNYNADFTVNNLQLSIGEIAVTRKSCPNLDIENQFLAALKKVTRYSKTDNTLTLTDAESNVVIVANAQTE